MNVLILYLGLTVVGYFVGAFLEKKNIVLKGTGVIQTLCIMLLVFTMGSRIGADDEIVKSLGTIGLTAFIMTLIILASSVAAVLVVRKILGFNKTGDMIKRCESAEVSQEVSSTNITMTNDDADDEKSGSKMTLYIVLSVAAGIIMGYLILPDAFIDISGILIVVGLCVLLFFVGMDIGREGTIIENFKQAGWRIMIFPFVIIIGTLIGSVIGAIILPVSVKDALCVGSGLGWYSLAPAMLAEYSTEISAISFMHNVMRELFAILLIPFVAKRVGYIETVALPGAAAMDVCLPIVEKATKSDIAVYSFISGVVASIAVPILVGFMMGI